MSRRRMISFLGAGVFVLLATSGSPASAQSTINLPGILGSPAVPTGAAFDPVTNTYFVVTRNPPLVAQVSAVNGALVTAPHNPAAAPYVNPASVSHPNLAAPILQGPSPGTPAGTTPASSSVSVSGVALDFYSNTLYLTAYTPGDSFLVVIGSGADGVLLTADDTWSYWNTRTFFGVASAPIPAGLLSRPEGIAWNPLSRALHVVDFFGQGVFEISTAGVVVFSFGQSLVGQPLGIEVFPPTNGLLILGQSPFGDFHQLTLGGANAGGVGSFAGATNLTDLVYNHANGLVYGLEAGTVSQLIPAGAGAPQGPGIGSLLMTGFDRQIISNPNASTGQAGGVVTLATSLESGIPGGSAAWAFNLGIGAAPPGAVTNVHNFTVVFFPPAPATGTVFSPPVSLTLPLLNQGVPGTPLGLFAFGAAAPPAGPTPLKALGTVDPSGMTATFPAVGFLSFVTAVPLGAPPQQLAAIAAGGLDPIIRSFGLATPIQRRLLRRLDRALEALASPDPDERAEAPGLFLDFLRLVQKLTDDDEDSDSGSDDSDSGAGKPRGLSAGQAEILAGTVETVLVLLEAAPDGDSDSDSDSDSG